MLNSLTLILGGQGKSRPTDSDCPSGYISGGFNGGGTSGGSGAGGAGGGGASDIRSDCSDYSTVMVVAGGGGGGKVACISNKAAIGGYPGGMYVLNCNSAKSLNQQGNQNVGGTYGTCNFGSSFAGTSGVGGNGNTDYGRRRWWGGLLWWRRWLRYRRCWWVELL